LVKDRRGDLQRIRQSFRGLCTLKENRHDTSQTVLLTPSTAWANRRPRTLVSNDFDPMQGTSHVITPNLQGNSQPEKEKTKTRVCNVALALFTKRGSSEEQVHTLRKGQRDIDLLTDTKRHRWRDMDNLLRLRPM
jgi:hypothetical protein